MAENLTSLASLLACPRCNEPLLELRCKACQVTYPAQEGLPWLFADPDATRTEWRNRFNMELARIEQDRDRAAAALQSSEDAQSATSKRLHTLVEGYSHYHAELDGLLQPLLEGKRAKLETYLALRTRLPPRQGLTSYTANVFRDWCWGDRENTAALAEVAAFVPTLHGKRLLVLGAGAGRLAYDLHQALKPALTVALDNNPLLGILARRLTIGHTQALTEFPLAPNRIEAVAMTRQLKAPEPARDGFFVLLGSALRAPVVANSFDVVLTPWLIDVIDEPPGDLLPRINRLILEQGLWINHGSLAFQQTDPTQRLQLPELEALAACSGFADFQHRELEVPYMDCPDSRHGRLETVLTTSARKTSNTEQPPRHQSLPEWIVSGRDSVPLLPAFQNQAMATRVHAFIMSLIDGKRSLKDIAAAMEQQRLMTRKDAEVAVRGFLIKMFEEADTAAGL